MDGVLQYMGKPSIAVYEKFMELYQRLNQRYGKAQFVVPYLMSSHPGSTMDDAVALALYLKKKGVRPEQVQDFYPTPGTISTCMYYTGLDPMTEKPVYVARDPYEKAMQRALLQYTNPKNARLVREALRFCHREDLIGYTRDCLIRPERDSRGPAEKKPGSKGAGEKKLQSRGRTGPAPRAIPGRNTGKKTAGKPAAGKGRKRS